MAAAGLSLSRRRRPRWLDRLLVNTILLAGLVGVILAVQPLVLLALGRFPTSEERTVLVVSMIAAGVAALLYQPARKRLEQAASRLLPTEREAPGEVLRALGSGLSRAVPLDELIVELAESLRTALVLDATEVWTGSGGLLERVTSDPERGWASLTLAPAEESVVARAGVSGPAWLEVWLPALLEDRAGGPLRVAPMANARELLGLVVAERRPGGEPFGELDERVLAEFARQVALALHNVRLDSQLQASLDEVKRQTEEVTASRARVVSAADAERRRIERDLHDGAQQQLVALCANLRLARELAGSDPEQATALLEELGHDIEAALEDLRELAHGIYPPLLADRGLPEALSAVAPSRTDPHTARGRGDWPLPAADRIDGVLLLPRGPAECRQARRRGGLSHGPGLGEGGRPPLRDLGRRRGLRPSGRGTRRRTHEHDRPARRNRRNAENRVGPGRGTRIAGAIPLGR